MPLDALEANRRLLGALQRSCLRVAAVCNLSSDVAHSVFLRGVFEQQWGTACEFALGVF